MQPRSVVWTPAQRCARVRTVKPCARAGLLRTRGGGTRCKNLERGGGLLRETNQPGRDRHSGERASAQARGRRRAGSREPSRSGGNPWGGRNPREQRAGRRDLSAPAPRTSGVSKALQPGEAGGGSRRPFEPTARGQERAERRGPSPRRGKLRRVNPKGVRGTKQGRGVRSGSKAPRGPANPAGATYRARQTRVEWAAASASAEGERTPREWPCPMRVRRPVAVKLCRGHEVRRARSRRNEPHRRQRANGTPRRSPSGKAMAGALNPYGATFAGKGLWRPVQPQERSRAFREERVELRRRSNSEGGT